MSNRFDFLEIGDAKPLPPPPEEANPALNSSLGWKPLRLRAVEVIGEAGQGAGQFSAPTGLVVDAAGSLYVADSNNHRVQRITPAGDVFVYGKPGNMPGQLWGPQAVAIDPTGQFIFIAEQGNNRVQCFRIINGQHLGCMSGFRSPSGITFDAEGMLWVSDTGNARILRFNVRSNGQHIGTLDKAVGIVRPMQISCDRAHNLYITDGVTKDVTRYTYAGIRAHALGEIRKLNLPQQTAVDGQGRIYLAEAGADRLHIFDTNGSSLLTYDMPSTRLGPFRAPSGVALGPNGEIYLADTLNHRILRLAWE